MPAVTIREMLEAGAHFGHQTAKWDPRMKSYIYGARGGIHIIDLQQTLSLARKAADEIGRIVAQGGDVLFVGTKKQAQRIIQDEARRCQMHYVDSRWLGGMLTNFKTVQASTNRLKDYDKRSEEENGFSGLKKKEVVRIQKERVKLNRALGGIKEMSRLPRVLFVIDPKREHIALKEAARLGIPVAALADTNCNPSGIEWLIPANDDSIKSIRLFTRMIADAVLEGSSRRQAVVREQAAADEEAAQSPLARERVVEGKAKAYVSKAEAYVEGEEALADVEISKTVKPVKEEKPKIIEETKDPA